MCRTALTLALLLNLAAPASPAQAGDARGWRRAAVCFAKLRMRVRDLLEPGPKDPNIMNAANAAKARSLVLRGDALRSIEQLAPLRQALSRAASEDTAFDRATYRQKAKTCPLAQHCAVASRVALWLFPEGELVEGSVGGALHYWLRLPFGAGGAMREVDLTSDQNGGDGFNPVPGSVGRVTPVPARVSKRLRRFAERTLQELASSDGTISWP